MKVIDALNREEGLRLECLRLAVAAGRPDLSEKFYAFVAEGKAMGLQPFSGATPSPRGR